MSAEILAAALAWADTGACVLPAKSDGSKAPAVREWKVYQARRPDEAQLRAWFAEGNTGMGVVCGPVSGELEMVEFEYTAMAEGLFGQVGQICDALGLGELWARVTTGGYMEMSPTRGLHLFWYLIDGPVPGNTKLARRLATPQELAEQPDNKVRVLMETRGRGGWVVTAPSNGTTHPSGRSWEVLCGQPASIARITVAEREQLIRVIASFDQLAVPVPLAADPQTARTDSEELRPGDDYNDRAAWEDILVGWRKVYVHQGTAYWRRPGKDRGVSATTGYAHDADRLFPFTTNTEFEAWTPYSKFAAYALLNHGGDYAAAAAQLRREGYGAPREGRDSAAQQREAFKVLTGETPAAASTPVISTGGLTDKATECEVAGWLATQCRDQLVHAGQFYYWTGSLWSPQDRESGMQFQVAIKGCEAVPSDQQKWGSYRTISNVVNLLKSDPALQVNTDELDPHPHHLNTPAGIVDLRTGEVMPHDPAMMCTRITRSSPDRSAQAPRFEQFLAETFPNEQTRTYVQTLLGYCLLGHNERQIFILAHGNGRNGKSLLCEAVMRGLGSYGGKGVSDGLIKQNGKRHTEETAYIERKRFIYYSEVDTFSRLDEQLIKELSGGETINIRSNYGHQRDARNECTLLLIANELPRVTEGGRSIWHRVRTIPFTHEVPLDRVDWKLPELFATPQYGAAILCWLIDGAVRYHQQGLESPPEVIAATNEFRRDAAGTIGQYAAERLILGGGDAARVPSTVLYQDYVSWCATNFEQAEAHGPFTKRLIKEIGLGQLDTVRGRPFTGVTLVGDDA